MDPVNARDIIEATLIGLAARQPRTQREAADLILSALGQAGVEVINPQDLSWGVCDGEGSSGPHTISLSLCSGCLEYDPD